MSTKDQLLSTKLDGTAARLASKFAKEPGSITDAVAELRELAGDRTDLLAEAAGIAAGAWSTRLKVELGTTPLAFALLILAGADGKALPEWYETGRRRALAPMHGGSRKTTAADKRPAKTG